MKLIDKIFIAFCLLSFINSTCHPDEENNKIRDDDDCNKRTFSEEESANQAYKCCYLKLEIDSPTMKGDEYSCIALTQEEYDHVKNTASVYENNSGVKKAEIDCKSSYLKYGLIFLFLFFF